MKRAAILTLYNPGNVGARYAAAALKEAGVDVRLVHLKQFSTEPWVARDDVEQISRIEADAIKKVRFTFPGWYVYAPYPHPITNRERDLLLDYLRELQPDVVGLSLYTVNYDLARDLTEWLRAELPETTILWGGVDPTLRPDECARVADIVCVGEGERPLAELVRRWDEYKRGDAPQIPGLWFRRNGDVVEGGRPPYERELDSIPFPIYGENEVLIDGDKLDDRILCSPEYLSAGYNIVVMTERGCPYACTFCVYSVLHDLYPGQPRFRRRSVENVLAEVEDRVERLGLRHIIFHDEILAAQKEWVSEFATKFKERFTPRGVTFTGYVHPLTTGEESLKLLVEAGLTRTGIGLQSGSSYTAKEVYRRPLKKDKVIQLSKWLAKYKVDHVQIDLLVDNPHEREEHLRETLDLLLDLEPPFHIMLFGLVIYSTSRLAERPTPDFPYDEKMHLFYNMLFLLTEIPDLERETIRAWADDKYFREHPGRLEQIARALWDVHRKKREAEKALAAAQPAAACPVVSPSPPPRWPEGPVWNVLRRVKRRIWRAAGR